GGGGGGVVYVGGGYAEGGAVGGSYASAPAVVFVGPAPVSAPVGYPVYGFGRDYIGWRPYRPHPPIDCGCRPPYPGHDREMRYEDRRDLSRRDAYEAHVYEERAYEERAYEAGGYYREEGSVPAPTPYVEYPPIYGEPEPLPPPPPPPPTDYYGDLPPPGNVPPQAPPRQYYAQEPGERG
ncbi:MAG: hypothetical protein ACK4IW_05610, partial [Brevundimonas aurantiaca]